MKKMLVVVDTDKIKARAFDGIMETFSEAKGANKAFAIAERVEEISEKYNEVYQLITDCTIPVSQIKEKKKA